MASSPYPQHPWLQTALELLSNEGQEAEDDDSEFEDLDPESVVVEQLNRLTLQERDRVREEIGGMIDVPDESDTVFVSNRLSEMVEAVRRLAASNASAAYHSALIQSPEYVGAKDFLLKFLRADSFHPKMAAKRLMNYFEFVRKYFGDSALGRPIGLQDLDREDMATLRGGKFQILRARDRVGRLVVCDAQVSDEKLYNNNVNLVKAVFYIWCTMAEDPETSRKGASSILLYIGDYSKIPIDFGFMKLGLEAQQAVPLRFTAGHVCLSSSNGVVGSFLSNVIKHTQPRTVRRVKVHNSSSYIECRHSLMTDGIPIDHIPVTESVQLKTKNHLQWIQQRRIQEIARKKGAPFNGIETPMPLDVLGGQGKPIQEYSGNVRLKELVHAALSTYDAASGGRAKEDIAKQIIAAVQEPGGRFLERRTSDGFWEEVPLEKAIERVRVCLRNARATNRRRRQVRQETGSVAQW